jgi:hypothetical protein
MVPSPRPVLVWGHGGKFHSLPEADSFCGAILLGLTDQLLFYPQLWWISVVKTIRVSHFPLIYPVLPSVCLIIGRLCKLLFLFKFQQEITSTPSKPLVIMDKRQQFQQELAQCAQLRSAFN